MRGGAERRDEAAAVRRGGRTARRAWMATKAMAVADAESRRCRVGPPYLFKWAGVFPTKNPLACLVGV